jgi:nucleoside-diphosphate-sugar epimerase
MGKIAIFGAGGAIGSSLASELRARQRPYRVVGRSEQALRTAFGRDPLAEIRVWNPDDPDSVRAAADGVDTIVYAVGVSYWDFRLHPPVMRAAVEGAIAAGVERFLLIGTVYAYGLPRTERVVEDHPREPHTFKGRMRKEQEDVLMAADAAGKLRGAVLRLPDFYGPNVEKSFLHGAFVAALAGKRAALIGPVDRPHQYLFTPDAGPVTIALADEPAAYGRTWHYAGSGTIEQREFVRRIYAAAGTPLRTFVVNEPLLRVAGLFDKLMREMGEMQYLQTTPVVMDDAALRRLLPHLQPATSYDDGIRLTLQAMRTPKQD